MELSILCSSVWLLRGFVKLGSWLILSTFLMMLASAITCCLNIILLHSTNFIRPRDLLVWALTSTYAGPTHCLHCAPFGPLLGCWTICTHHQTRSSIAGSFASHFCLTSRIRDPLLLHFYVQCYVCLRRLVVTSMADLPGLACYVPRNDDLVSVLNTSHGELVTLRRAFISRTMRLLEPVMLGQAKLTFDDAVTAIMLCSIGASEDSTDKHQSQWLSFTFLAIRKLGPEIEDEVSDEEVNEEHRRFVELFISAHLFSEVNIQCDIRRLWWSVYMLDRHVALSFNIRPQLTDQQCQNLQVPCPDAIWASLTPLERNLHANNAVHRGIGYTVRSLDEFELLVPLMRYYLKFLNSIIS